MLGSLSDEGLIAYEVTGDELANAQLNNGDIPILKPVEKAKNGDMVIFLHAEHSPIVGFIQYESWGIRLRSPDPNMPEVVIDSSEDWNLGGKVVMVVR